MRVLFLIALLAAVCLCVFGAPQRHNLQSGPGPNDADSKPYVEEVVVMSVLHVRNPNAGRTGRTNTRVNLQDGARVAEMKRS